MVKLDKFLYRNTGLCFSVFFVFVLWAFWPRYFSDVLGQKEMRFHTHGITLTLWCILLILQAYLIRTKHKRTHQLVGRFSYLLVPLIIVTTINLKHFRMQGSNMLADRPYYSLALILNGLVLFTLLYGLAIYYRRTPLVHARYMVSTMFAFFTPVTDRIISRHFKPLLQLVPVLEGKPIAPVIGFAMADLLLLILLLWDWRTNRRLDVFPIALGLFVLYQASVLTFYHFAFWRAFGAWFVRLPLS
jgi:hypothetical protein